MAIGWHDPFVWLVGLNIVWDCLVLYCILGLHDQWEFPPFWQTPVTVPLQCLPFGLCKETMKESTTNPNAAHYLSNVTHYDAKHNFITTGTRIVKRNMLNKKQARLSPVHATYHRNCCLLTIWNILYIKMTHIGPGHALIMSQIHDSFM